MSMGYKPADCFLMNHQGTFMFELKVSKNIRSLTITSMLQGIQFDSLKACHNPAVNNYAFAVIRLDKIKKSNRAVILLIPFEEELFTTKQNIEDLIEKYSVPYIYDYLHRTYRLNIFNK